MKILTVAVLMSLAVLGCSPVTRDPRVEYGSAVSSIRSLPFSAAFLDRFGDDCLVTATYYDGVHGPPGAVLSVVHDRRYEISAHCDVQYTAHYKSVRAITSWKVKVSEIQKVDVSSHGTPIVHYGRTWTFTEEEWSKLVTGQPGLVGLKLPSIPESSGNGIELVEKQYGKSVVDYGRRNEQ